jgi:hypothetical protein
MGFLISNKLIHPHVLNPTHLIASCASSCLPGSTEPGASPYHAVEELDAATQSLGQTLTSNDYRYGVEVAKCINVFGLRLVLLVTCCFSDLMRGAKFSQSQIEM